MPIGINTNNESIIAALNNKVDLDANNTDLLVKVNDNQTIDGTKTFIQDIFHSSLTPWIYNNLATVDKGVVPDALETSGFGVYDKNVENNDESTIGQRRIGAFSVNAHPNYYGSSIIVNKPEKDSIESVDIAIVWPFNEDKPYTRAPYTRDEPNDNEIVTVSYLRTHYLSLTSNQDIYGVKTFHQDIQIKSEDNQDITPQVDLVYHDVDRSTAPDITRFCGVTSSDKNNNPLGALIFEKQVDNVDTTCLRVYDASGRQANFRMYYPPEGNPYILAPSTRDNPDDHEIVTIDYLNKKIKELQDQITTLQQQLASN